MQLTNKKYPGDAKFQKLLTKINCGFDTYTMRSLISGHVWGLELISPAEIIETIPFKVTGDDESKAGPQTEEEHREFFEYFLSLWNEFANDNTKKVRKIRPLPKDIFSAQDLINSLMNLYNDVSVFVEAMEETNSVNSLDLHLKVLFYGLNEVAYNLDKALEKHCDKDYLSKTEYKKLIDCYCVSRFRWSEAYHILGKALKDIQSKMYIDDHEEPELVDFNKPRNQTYQPLRVVPPPTQ